MPDSPLKQIILPFVLDRPNLDRGQNWKDEGQQLVHIEPMDKKTFCAVVLQIVARNANGECTLKIDIKLENEDHEWKIDPSKENTKLVKKSTGDYDWDLYVNVIPRNGNEATSHELEGTYKLVSGQFMDLHFSPDYLDQKKLDEKELLILGSRRICKIRIF